MSKPIYALIDCNNFFVSCERVFRPDLWNSPVAVLSNNDGCIVARSNEVKQLGVPMGIPEFKVRELLRDNNVTLFSGNFGLYGDFSQRVVHILRQACPDIEIYSVDESFLELSSLPVRDYSAWARDVRQRIWQWIGIPVSIGIAPTKTLAKAASEFAKQHPESAGVHSIVPDDICTAKVAETARQQLVRWLPVGDVWGVGWRTAPTLRQQGVATAYDLSQVSDGWAQKNLNIRGLKTVRELRGESWLALENTDEAQQSIACTRSFGHTVRAYHELEAAIATFAAQAAVKLRRQREVTRRVLVFLRSNQRDEGWQGVSAIVPLLQPSADTGVIIETALRALQQIHDPDKAYKKGGVVLLDLVPEQATQLTLLGNSIEQLERQDVLMRAVDQINRRFGLRQIRHASEQPGNASWHSRRERRSPLYTTRWQDLPRLTL